MMKPNIFWATVTIGIIWTGTAISAFFVKSGRIVEGALVITLFVFLFGLFCE